MQLSRNSRDYITSFSTLLHIRIVMGNRNPLTGEQKYEMLKEISYKIRDTMDLNEILNHLLDAVRSVVEYDAAGIFVLNREFVKTPFESPVGIIAGIVQRGFGELPPERDPMLILGRGVVGHVINNGQAVNIPDVRLDERYVEGRKATKSEIAVPLVRNKRTIGALNLESDRLAAFEETDHDILSFFADAASISIEKALLHLQILESKRIDDQLRIAAEIQAQLLPQSSPTVAGYDIAGLCIPTFEIGGDYFDYIPFESNRYGIVIADVSGNGIPAALLMSSFRALLLTNARAGKSPPELMKHVNTWLPEIARKRDFITALYGILDPQKDTFTYANCGHNRPLFLHADGAVTILEHGGPSLNLFPDSTYEAGEVHLFPGDQIVLYTDGVVEVFNTKGDDLGVEGLTALIRESQRETAAKMIEEIAGATHRFAASERPRDDFAMVVIKRDAASDK